jgi:hypothetical protein
MKTKPKTQKPEPRRCDCVTMKKELAISECVHHGKECPSAIVGRVGSNPSSVGIRPHNFGTPDACRVIWWCPWCGGYLA